MTIHKYKVDGYRTPTIISESTMNGGMRTYFFKNNIIYNNSTTARYSFLSSSFTSRTIDYNVFYGNHPSSEPADANKLTSDPKLANPGGATYGLASCAAYKILSGSPAINSGTSITYNGGYDFFGNVLYDGAADRGCHEY